MSCGAIWLSRGNKQERVRRAKTKLKPGDCLTYYYSADLLKEPQPQLQSIHIDSDFSVWLKPRYMTVSGSRFCDHTSLKRCIEAQHPAQPTTYIVHRLDRFTAGLFIVAHNKKYAAKLSDLFRTHKIHKRYHAWVEGFVSCSTNVGLELDGKSARSDVSPVTSRKDKSLVEVIIHTGRKHQVRRHLAAIGHPIIGDRQQETDHSFDLQLAATQLEFALEDRAFSFQLNWRDLLESF